jgi:hypothetical protein
MLRATLASHLLPAVSDCSAENAACCVLLELGNRLIAENTWSTAALVSVDANSN